MKIYAQWKIYSFFYITRIFPEGEIREDNLEGFC